jgi:FixJ family two-component response regulator
MVKVAIVDDDHSVRTALERLFLASGYEVSLFASAEEFLAHLPAGRPDCLILDRQMGGMSGDDLMKLLAAQGIMLPIIMISGLVDESSPPPRKLFARLRKPFSVGAILSAVDAVLDEERSSRA